MSSEGLPLMPSQRMILRKPPVPPERYTFNLGLTVPDDFDVGLAEEALRQIAERHDALNLGLSLGPNGWEQRLEAGPTADRLIAPGAAVASGAAREAQIRSTFVD